MNSLMINSSELLNNLEIPITIKNQLLISPGNWNNSTYKPNEIQDAYLNTDWNDKSNFSLYLDHKDTQGEGAENWVGYVKNMKIVDKSLHGDLEVWNPMLAVYLTKAKAKFGVSATLKGQEDEKNIMRDFHFESFSIVTNPACKDAYINLSQKERSNERRLKIITMAEEVENKEQQTDEEKAKAEEKPEEPKEDEPKKPEEMKKEKLPSPDKEEMSEDNVMNMLESMDVKELSAWTDFVKKMRGKYPNISFKDIAKAYKSGKKNSEELEEMNDVELIEKLSQINDILRLRKLAEITETPEQKIEKLNNQVKELQQKMNEPERKTLSSAPAIRTKADTVNSSESLADFILGGGNGTFTI